MRFGIDFSSISGDSDLEKSTKTIVFSMVFVNFHKIDAFEQITKTPRFGSRFRKPKPRQIEKKTCWKTCVVLTSIFQRWFWTFGDLGSILGGQKSFKSWKKCNNIAKKTKKRRFWDGLCSEGSLRKGLGGFWEGFGKVLKGFGEGLGGSPSMA